MDARNDRKNGRRIQSDNAEIQRFAHAVAVQVGGLVAGAVQRGFHRRGYRPDAQLYERDEATLSRTEMGFLAVLHSHKHRADVRRARGNHYAQSQTRRGRTDFSGIRRLPQQRLETVDLQRLNPCSCHKYSKTAELFRQYF